MRRGVDGTDGLDDTAIALEPPSHEGSETHDRVTVGGDEHLRRSEDVLFVLPRVEPIEARVAAPTEGLGKQRQDVATVGGLERPQLDCVVGAHVRAQPSSNRTR